MSTTAYGAAPDDGGNIKINGDRLREPMQKVTDKFKELVGLPKQEGNEP